VDFEARSGEIVGRLGRPSWRAWARRSCPGSAVVEAGVSPGSEPVTQEHVMNVCANIDGAQFPTMVAAIGEAMASLNDKH